MRWIFILMLFAVPTAAAAQWFKKAEAEAYCEARYSGKLARQCVEGQEADWSAFRKIKAEHSQIKILNAPLEHCEETNAPRWDKVRSCAAAQVSASQQISRLIGRLDADKISDAVRILALKECWDAHPEDLAAALTCQQK